jgi:hypothetical protein
MFVRSIAKAANRSGAIAKAQETAQRFIHEATGALAEADGPATVGTSSRARTVPARSRDGVMLVDTYRQLAQYAIQRQS